MNNKFMKSIKEKINESLIISYDSNKLISKLNKYFGNIEETHKHSSKSDIQRFSLKINDKEFEKVYDEKLFKILDFYGYYITEIACVQNENKYVLSFEPIFGKKCNDLVYKECNGIVYHITKNKYIKKIRSKGLIPLEGKTYRTFTERIFLSVGKTDEEIIENINLLTNQISRNNDYIILRIDLNKNKYNVDFYFDPSEDDKHNFIYCNAYFPPHMIEEIGNIDDLKNKLKSDSEISEAKYVNTKLGKLYIKNI